jgi:hypothetical protein
VTTSPPLIFTTLGRRWMPLRHRRTCIPCIWRAVVPNVQRILWSFFCSSIRALSYFASAFFCRVFRSKEALNPKRKNVELLFMLQKIYTPFPPFEWILFKSSDRSWESTKGLWSMASFIIKPAQWSFLSLSLSPLNGFFSFYIIPSVNTIFLLDFPLHRPLFSCWH